MCVHMLIRKCESAREGDTDRTIAGETRRENVKIEERLIPCGGICFSYSAVHFSVIV